MLTSLPEHAHLSTCFASIHPAGDVIAAAGLDPADRVVVVGPGALGHLLALARLGCRSAAAFRSLSACRGEEESADVVWFTGIGRIDAGIETVIDHLDTPRIVIVELGEGGVGAVVGRLRAKGFVEHVLGQVDGRSLIIASRPAWLRRVI